MVSREAKVLIKKMLTYNPDERISADQALNDEWIFENTAITQKHVTDQLQ
jgi:serine/threonine protein kinase